MDVDTIAALSTAPGVGAIAVVRMSGPGAFQVLERVVPEWAGALGEMAPARTATLARICSPEGEGVIDHALVTRFPGPDSYTGEDLVEISSHGGVLVPALVLEACLVAGARAAEAGEFTRRAYLNGRLDLVQAEAVADLIHARSRALHRASVAQLDRGLSERVQQLRSALLGLEAVLAHHVDFPEEDDAPVPLADIAAQADELSARLGRLLATAPEGELLRAGALVVLAGAPNAGKSTLYNALLGRERAIVTPEPGTTRDALEAEVEFGGFPFRVVDTAGLRDTEHVVERLGIEVTRRYAREADVVLLCVEAGRPLTPDEAAFLAEMGSARTVVVRTKADLAACDTGHGGHEAHTGPAGPAGREGRDADAALREVLVSALTGHGLDVLRRTLPELVFRGLVRPEADVPVVTRRRHARALEGARGSVTAFAEALHDGVPPEMASTHLREAEGLLEELVGVVSTEDILDVVFREFCVGK